MLEWVGDCAYVVPLCAGIRFRALMALGNYFLFLVLQIFRAYGARIPEPETWALMLCGAGVFAWRRNGKHGKYGTNVPPPI